MDCVLCLCNFAFIVTVEHILEYIFQKAALQNVVCTLNNMRFSPTQAGEKCVCVYTKAYLQSYAFYRIMLLQTVQ